MNNLRLFYVKGIRMKEYVKRQKWILIAMCIIIFMIVGFGIGVSFLNDYPQNSDILMWFEVIIISALINIVSALFIISIVDDHEKRLSNQRKKYLVSVIGIKNRKIKELICNTYQDFSGNVFNTGEEMEKFLESLSDVNNPFYSYDYSSTCKYYNLVSQSNNQIQQGNWIEYLYLIISKNIDTINDFLPAYFPFLSLQLYNEVYDYLKKINENVLIWEGNDKSIVSNTNYTASSNKNVMLINLIPTLIERINTIDNLITKE
jgi:hypothetical protein